MQNLVAYAGAYAFAFVFLGVGCLLLVPTLVAVFGVWAIGHIMARRGKLISVAFVVLALATLLFAWHRHREAYRMQADAIAARIATAPKLGSVDGRSMPLVTSRYPEPEVALRESDCFPNLWIRPRTGPVFSWGGRGGEPAPSSYLEFNVDEDEPSRFGDPHRTGRRGPYELWLVQPDKRTLVNVFFLQGDGHMFLPPLLWFYWVKDPALLDNKEFRAALRNFLYRTKGRCAARPKSG